MEAKEVIVVQPKVSEYADEHEQRLAEFVIRKDAERAATNGAAALQIRDKQISELAEDGDKVSALYVLTSSLRLRIKSKLGRMKSCARTRMPSSW